MFPQPDDLRYAFECLGGMTMFGLAWWIACIILRAGFDGIVLALCLIKLHRYANDFSQVAER